MGEQATPTRKARVDDILTLAARIWEVDRADLLGKSRFAKHSRPRQAIMLIAREHGHSFPQIGKRLGRNDHTTVIHGCHNAKAVIRIEPDYAAKVDLLRQQVLEAEAFIAKPVARPEPIVFTPRPKPPQPKPRNVFQNDDKGFQWHGLEQAKHRKRDLAFIAALNAAGGHRRAA